MVNSHCHRIQSCDYKGKANDMLYGNYNKELCSGEEFSHAEQASELKNPNFPNFEPPRGGEDSDYEILPQKYFKYKDIPPPLVRRSWLKLFHEEWGQDSSDSELDVSSGDESNGEDSIPLSDLKQILASAQVCDTNIVKQTDDNEVDSGDELSLEGFTKSSAPIIHRKRGRPRKQNPTPVTEGVEDNLSNDKNFISDSVDGKGDSDNDDDDDWWSKSIDISNESASGVKEDEVKEAQDCEINTSKADHYLQVEEEVTPQSKTKKSSNLKKAKKKDVSNEIHGIKMENSSKVVFPCMECGKSFSAASTLKYHLRIHNGTLIKCTECDRGFTTNYLLKCHMRIHNGDLFMCHKCGRGFTTAELLKVHSRSHTGVRPYSCDVCGKSFPSASNLTQHKETHEPEKKYLCFQCGSSFSQKRCLDGHMLSHGEKNHICTVCGKLWARKSDLTEHMRVHTGYKPYSCSSCPQKFTQASSLRRHQIVHKDANPVQCLTCGKMLKCDEYYKRHLKRHVKEKELQLAVVVE